MKTKQQTLYKVGHYKLEFYEADIAGTWCWDVMYNKEVMADGKNDIFASLSAAKRGFRAAQKAMAKFAI